MSKDLQLVGFRIGRETFGVPIGLVHEIVRVPEITSVPDAPRYVEGVINLRGTSSRSSICASALANRTSSPAARIGFWSPKSKTKWSASSWMRHRK
jgi:hypothetical protein